MHQFPFAPHLLCLPLSVLNSTDANGNAR